MSICTGVDSEWELACSGRGRGEVGSRLELARMGKGMGDMDSLRFLLVSHSIACSRLFLLLSSRAVVVIRTESSNVCPAWWCSRLSLCISIYLFPCLEVEELGTFLVLIFFIRFLTLNGVSS